MSREQPGRLWLVGGVLAAIVTLLAGYFMFIGPQRGQTSDVRGQVSDARTRNLALQQQIDTLETQSKNLATYQAALRQAERALPSTSGLPDFLRTLASIGNATLADVTSLTVGTPTDVNPAQPNGTTGSTPSSAPRTGSTPTGGPGQPGGHVYALAITAQVSGTVSALEKFLTQLQSVQPRAVLISQVTLSSGGGDPSGKTGLTLTMQAFVAPGSTPESPGTTAESSQLPAAAQR